MIEFLAIVSVHSPNLIEGSDPLSDLALERYRAASERQAGEWIESLDHLPEEILAAPAQQRGSLWNDAAPLFHDVFAGGLTARLWGAVLTACDRRRKTLSAERIARAALARHEQVLQRALRMMVDGPWLTLERVVALDRIRRKVERWSDLLTGHIICRWGLGDFAYNADRAIDFGTEQLAEGRSAQPLRIWDMYVMCLRSTFPEMPLPGGVVGEQRDEVHRSILNSLPPSLYLADGTMLSVELKKTLAAGGNEGPAGPEWNGATIVRLPEATGRIHWHRGSRNRSVRD